MDVMGRVKWEKKITLSRSVSGLRHRKVFLASHASFLADGLLTSYVFLFGAS